MADVLDEVTSEKITKDHVAKRVEDWVRRLNALYDLVESWLPSGWRADRRRVVLMDEEMMRKFGVSPREVPVLDLNSANGSGAMLEPRGLWIVGTNGRVDLYAGSKHFIIVDRAENFASPDWQIVDFNERKKVEKFDKAMLVAALAQ
ncbi:MAG: hypothetical protein ACT4SY_06095 [Hyphomicrobiales bacterium]